MPVVDTEYLLETFDAETRAELLGMFKAQLETKFRFTETDDRKAMFFASHELKGTAGTVGCIALQQAASDLCEKLRDDGDADVSAEVVAHLLVERGRVLQYLSRVPLSRPAP